MCLSDKRSVISDAIKHTLSVEGVVYETLEQIYRQFGKAGLFAIIALPSIESNKKSRITAYPRIQAAILKHFIHAQQLVMINNQVSKNVQYKTK